MSAHLVQRLRAWSSRQIFIVLAAFLVYVLADGATFSFGLYVDELIKEYSSSKANPALKITAVAALTQSVPLLLSPFVCWATNKFGASAASLVGCIVSAIGYSLPFIFQVSKTFWIPVIGYGGFLSMGLAFSYVPAYLTLPFYFEEDRGLATGLAVSGSGVGQVALSMIVETCILRYGWRGASLITGSLFLFMLISVIAFFQPAPANAQRSGTPVDIELAQQPLSPTPSVKAEDGRLREKAASSQLGSTRRSRTATLVHVLPLFTSSVPVRAGITIPSTQPSPTRRHSFNVRPHATTPAADSSSVSKETNVPDFRRSRAQTIAVAPSVGRSREITLEHLRAPLRPLPLAPIASGEEFSGDEEEDQQSSTSSSLSLSRPAPLLSSEPTTVPDDALTEQHWLLNSRYLLFCFSNFALCLVMGVPYVIIPTYISETFHGQNYLASWTLSNVGIASAVGQVLLGYLHDRKVFSAWLMYAFAVIISGTSLIILAVLRHKLIVLICAFMFGLAISANYALQVLIVIDALSMGDMPNAFGILQFCQGVSTLIGIPIQGLLRDLSHTYKLSFLTSGLIIILSGMSMFLWPCLKTANIKKVTQIGSDR